MLFGRRAAIIRDNDFRRNHADDSMNAPDAILESTIPGLPLIGRGKVRDLYAVDDAHMLIVTTDRLSAYDVVLPDPVPGKGALLTRISRFWFAMMADLVPNHLSDRSLSGIVNDRRLARQLAERTMVVRRLDPLPIEAVVRGYLIGSGWRDYQSTGKVCGIELPQGLQQAAKLPQPIFTPASKADAGNHDENISFADVEERIGEGLAARVRDISLRIYARAAEYALQRGIIIADTKFEFGLDRGGELCLIDEILTPDSSRFWPADKYRPGSSPPSFDKQFVRDYLDTLDWDKCSPGPELPADILDMTAQKYQDACAALTAA